MIYLTSDFHFNHDREFIYKPRGFNSVDEMNNTIITNYNNLITPEDEVYILGDLMLGGPDKINEGLEMIRALNGKLHLVRGNHDTAKRWATYATLPNVVEQQNAIYLDYHKYHFYMSHYPALTANLEKESLHQCTLNLFGHVHQSFKFFEDRPYMYNVNLESQNNCPVLLDNIIEEMKAKVKECLDEL